MINIQEIIPDIIVELPYATEQNFMKTVLYDSNICYLHPDTAKALKRVQNNAKMLQLKLKILDGYRSPKIQLLMWEKIQDERYVTNPITGFGRHTRGTAVDVTLVNMDEEELEMPSKFDQFDLSADPNYQGGSEISRTNRDLLCRLMHEEGFERHQTEWWHFDLKGWENYPVIYPQTN